MGTGSAGSSAWFSTNQLIPVFVEGMATLIGGPLSSKNLPRRLGYTKTGVGLENGGKSWALKILGPKEKPTSSPSMTMLSVDSFKDVVVTIKHSDSLSPSTHGPLIYPSSVKSKKILSRKLASDISPKSAAPSSQSDPSQPPSS